MDDIINIEGDHYISSRKAASTSGYTSDYIGQLCRAGILQSKIVGQNRLVNLHSLVAYVNSPLSKKQAVDYVHLAALKDLETAATGGAKINQRKFNPSFGTKNNSIKTDPALFNFLQKNAVTTLVLAGFLASAFSVWAFPQEAKVALQKYSDDGAKIISKVSEKVAELNNSVAEVWANVADLQKNAEEIFNIGSKKSLNTLASASSAFSFSIPEFNFNGAGFVSGVADLYASASDAIAEGLDAETNQIENLGRAVASVRLPKEVGSNLKASLEKTSEKFALATESIFSGLSAHTANIESLGASLASIADFDVKTSFIFERNDSSISRPQSSDFLAKIEQSKHTSGEKIFKNNFFDSLSRGFSLAKENSEEGLAHNGASAISSIYRAYDSYISFWQGVIQGYLAMGEWGHNFSVTSLNYLYDLPTALLIKTGFVAEETAEKSAEALAFLSDTSQDTGKSVAASISGSADTLTTNLNTFSANFYQNINDFFNIKKKLQTWLALRDAENVAGENTQNTQKEEDGTTGNEKPAPADNRPIIVEGPRTIIENIKERVVVGEGVTAELLSARLSELNNKLSSEIYKVSSNTGSAITNVYQTVALTNKIDSLEDVTIDDSTITDATISGTSTFTGSSVTLTGGITALSGSFSGSLTVSGTATSTFSGDIAYDTSTLYIDSLNNRVGIGTTSPKLSLHVTGTDGIVIPFGTTAQRPTARRGILRYNTTTSQFEGYSGTAWAGLGGVIDVDGNTYILAESSAGANEDTLFFNTAGSERMRITSSGNVGIGTTSPYAKLSVVGASGVVAAKFHATSTTATSTFDGGFAVETSGLVYDRSTNKVGIGTASPADVLDVNGAIRIGTGTFVSGQARLYTTAAAGLTITGKPGSSYDMYLANGGGSAFMTVSTGTTNATWYGSAIYSGVTTDITTGTNEHLVIVPNGTGNVGIGTTSPYAKLSVVGSSGVVAAKFHATSTTATSTFAGGFKVGGNSGLTVYPTGRVGISNTTPGSKLSFGVEPCSVGGTANAIRIYDNGEVITSTSNNSYGFGMTGCGLLTYTAGTGGSHVWYTANTERMRITSTGSIGIATSTPYAALSVVGSSGVVAAKFHATSTTATSTFSGGVQIGRTESIFLGLTVYPTGKVGIGTLLPSNKLSVTEPNGVTSSPPALGAKGGTLGIYSGAQAYGLIIGSLPTGNSWLQSQAVDGTVAAYDLILQPTSGNVSIGELAPGSKLSVSGNATIGTGYDTTAAPTNGLIVQGNVGIGTTSPYAKLSVVGSSGVVAAKFHATSTKATSTFAGGLQVGSSGLAVYPTGRVGIGTNAPARKLVLSGTDSSAVSGPHIRTYTAADSNPVLEFLSYSHNLIKINFDAYLNDAESQYVSTYASSNFQISKQGDLTFNAAGPVSVGSAITWTPAITIKPDGDTLFGTTGGTQPQKVQIRGGDSVFNASGTSGKGFGVLNHASYVDVVGIRYDDGEWNPISFRTGTNAAQLYLDTTNRVGIGTTSPYAKLSVVGEVAARNFTATSTTATSTIAGKLKLTNLILNTGAATASLCLSSTNEVSRNTDAETCIASSARYKQNIEDLTYNKDLISNLRPVSFEYKQNAGEHYGFIAEEVELLDPLLVSYDEQGLSNGIRWTHITTLLVQAVQNLTKQYDELTASFIEGVTNFKEIITDKLTTKELCLEDVCITKSELETLLQNAGASSSSGGGSGTPTPEPTPEPTPLPASEPNLEPAPEPTPEPALEVTPQPEATPEPEPAPAPETAPTPDIAPAE